MGQLPDAQMPDGNIDDKVSKPTFNPLTPTGDQKANSPFLTNTFSSRRVMRRKKNINERILFD